MPLCTECKTKEIFGSGTLCRSCIIKGNRNPRFKPVEERFWSRVNKGGPNGCWEWTGYLNNWGYGAFWFKKLTNAHRYSWILHKGQIPPDLFVCHRCDNPKCVNPDHLFLGTCADNNKDREIKNRSNHPKGENHGRAKLDWDKVSQIRELYKQGNLSHCDLSTMFGISASVIGYVLNNKIWKS